MFRQIKCWFCCHRLIPFVLIQMDADDDMMCCVSRSHLSGRFCPVPEWGGEQHHPSREAGPEWRHDLPPLPLFHQLLTQHISHRYTHTHPHTHIEAVGECRFSSRVGFCIYIISLDWVLLLNDYMCSSSILPRMNALVANLEMQLRLHIILGFIPHRSVSEMHWSTQGAPTPHPRIRPYLIKSCHGTEVIDIHELNISLDW